MKKIIKITPDLTDGDYNKRVDEYDDDTVRFYESHTNDEYFYELYVLVDGEKSRIIVTEHGVSVDNRKSGITVHTDIFPFKLFPNKKKLSWDDLCKIIRILEVTGLEGRKHTKEEMYASYEEYLKSKEGKNENL